MKTFRKIVAFPFFLAGMAFLGLGAVILGDQQVDWLDSRPQRTH